MIKVEFRDGSSQDYNDGDYLLHNVRVSDISKVTFSGVERHMLTREGFSHIVDPSVKNLIYRDGYARDIFVRLLNGGYFNV